MLRDRFLASSSSSSKYEFKWVCVDYVLHGGVNYEVISILEDLDNVVIRSGLGNVRNGRFAEGCKKDGSF